MQAEVSSPELDNPDDITMTSSGLFPLILRELPLEPHKTLHNCFQRLSRSPVEKSSHSYVENHWLQLTVIAIV